MVFYSRAGKKRLHLRNNHLPGSLDYKEPMSKTSTTMNLDFANLYMHNIKQSYSGGKVSILSFYHMTLMKWFLYIGL